MKLRSIALALALALSFTAIVEAKHKTNPKHAKTHQVSKPKAHKSKPAKAA